jgi:methionine synthase II (cobalamin-independent)
LRWQVQLLRKFDKPIIAFIDEPYLAAFGSAYAPISREDVISGLIEFAEGLSRDVLLGVHCCGNTDWSMFIDTPGVGLINFDAFGFQNKFILYSASLKSFLKRGGIICWGIVPTQEFGAGENAQALTARLRQSIDELVKKGLEEKLLLESLMISPSCGLGTLEPQKAEQILRLLSEASAFIGKNL